MPSDFSTFANFWTLTYWDLYVSVRRSPGSPSQIRAALFRRDVSMWRSTQLTETFIFPPMNHFAWGGVHSSTVSPFLNHSSSSACDAPKACGPLMARSYNLPPEKVP